MRTLLILVAMLLATDAAGQEQPPQGPERWGVLVTQATVIAVQAEIIPGGQPRTYSVGTDVDTLLVVFPSLAACNEARNIALNPANFSLILGTGGGSQAHIGRTTTPCFRQP